ncbi:hypothetical protein ACFSFY_00005 [Sporosarcina siberiensis]|uniref:Uncharacterized protein n=1 Tax=Sporosarcina siberiensis TaxID=1365606 RepID=A0ABW4SAP8_9BACL
MSDIEEKRDKTKAFKASPKSLAAINEIIKKSGKNDTEFFEELVNDLLIKGLTDTNDENISVNLRKHFESDVQKLKNATNSILSIFVSQMENISVEKNQWHVATTKQLEEKQEAFEKQLNKYIGLKEEFEAKKQEAIKFEQDNDSLQKERDTLIKRTSDQEQLISDRTERIQDFETRINKLNETIVTKDEQLKEFSPIVEQKKELEVKNSSLNIEIENLKNAHRETLKKKEEQLIFECEKEKHRVETKLLEGFNLEKESVRSETRKETEIAIREFYLEEIQRKEKERYEVEKSYKLQIEKLQLEIENKNNAK